MTNHRKVWTEYYEKTAIRTELWQKIMFLTNQIIATEIGEVKQREVENITLRRRASTNSKHDV